VEIKLTLALPRDELSVPVARRVLRRAMDALGVEDEVTSDIEVALTEACTNVLDHAAETDEYEVSAGIDGDMCVIEVVDRGQGFDAAEVGLDDADHTAEGGRGIQIMRAVVDRVKFVNSPQVGTMVHLEKRLEWHDDSPLRTLTEGRPRTEHGPWSGDEHLEGGPDPR
jgi:serine/threonine-protein kinase RsbW